MKRRSIRITAFAAGLGLMSLPALADSLDHITGAILAKHCFETSTNCSRDVSSLRPLARAAYHFQFGIMLVHSGKKLEGVVEMLDFKRTAIVAGYSPSHVCEMLQGRSKVDVCKSFDK